MKTELWWTVCGSCKDPKRVSVFLPKGVEFPAVRSAFAKKHGYSLKPSRCPNCQNKTQKAEVEMLKSV